MDAINIISKAKREELVTKIEPLRQRIETWRKTRVRNEHMPEPLWVEATELAKGYGVAAVQGILRIDYNGLKRRALGIRVVGRPKPSGAGLVELPALSPLRRTEPIIELEDGAGRRMTVKVSGGNVAELVPLAQAFWRPGA